MDIAIAIIMLIFVAPLLEFLLTALASYIADSTQWQLFKEEFDRQTEDATDTAFIMAPNPETKGFYVFMLVAAVVVFIINLALYTVMYALDGMGLNDYIIIEIVSQALLLPMLLGVLHCATKKFYFADNEITIKSAIYVKRVQFEQITSVAEIQHTRIYLALKITYKKIKNNKIKAFKIAQTFGNYECAKKRFSDIQLLI